MNVILGIYALYVMFYPQLVAGPIERPQNVLHQFHERHYFSSQNLLDGLRLMLWGLFKKVVIADRLAQYVTIVYTSPEEYHYLNLILATLFFSIQIYCDFSGYSDMALGAAKTMGFDLMINFRRPYMAQNIQDFWSRWHISLSTWFRDYLYIPLGGNRKGKVRQYINTIIVFFISGLWHGANWTFMIWGALHAFYTTCYVFLVNVFKTADNKIPDTIIVRFVSWMLTFVFVSFAWIFFRAETLKDAGLIASHIFSMYHEQPFQIVLADPATFIQTGVTSLLISIAMILIMFGIEYSSDPILKKSNGNTAFDIIFISSILSLVIIFGVFRMPVLFTFNSK